MTGVPCGMTFVLTSESGGNFACAAIVCDATISNTPARGTRMDAPDGDRAILTASVGRAMARVPFYNKQTSAHGRRLIELNHAMRITTLLVALLAAAPLQAQEAATKADIVYEA